MIDNVYLRLSVTGNCNFSCTYCSPEVRCTDGSVPELCELEVIFNAALRSGVTKVRITGGEPLVRKDIDDVFNCLSDFPVERCLTTNGYFLEDHLDSLVRNNIRNVNISLDSLNRLRFKSITGVDGYDRVVRIVRELALDDFFNLKINVVVMKGINDDEWQSFFKFARDYDVEVRFIEYMPFGPGKVDYDKRFLSGQQLRMKMPDLKFRHFFEGSSSRCYEGADGKGRVSFIEALSHPFCQSCRRLRITSKLVVKPCLASEDGIELAGLVRTADPVGAVEGALVRAFGMKKFYHNIGDEEIFNHDSIDMKEIGG